MSGADGTLPLLAEWEETTPLKRRSSHHEAYRYSHGFAGGARPGRQCWLVLVGAYRCRSLKEEASRSA
jgi:hypothetical protein